MFIKLLIKILVSYSVVCGYFERLSEIEFVPSDKLSVEVQKIFPNGLYLTQYNTQKLLDVYGNTLKEFNVNGSFEVGGDICHFKDSKLHREDGPAIEHDNGTKEWYLNGKRHRTDGPAVEFADGSKYWYKDGKLHRDFKPAVEYADGKKEWYVNGQRK